MSSQLPSSCLIQKSVWESKSEHYSPLPSKRPYFCSFLGAEANGGSETSPGPSSVKSPTSPITFYSPVPVCLSVDESCWICHSFRRKINTHLLLDTQFNVNNPAWQPGESFLSEEGIIGFCLCANSKRLIAHDYIGKGSLEKVLRPFFIFCFFF